MSNLGLEFFRTGLICRKRLEHRSVDLSLPWFESGYQLATLRNSASLRGWDSLLSPFSKDLWLAILGTVLLLVGLMYIVDRPTSAERQWFGNKPEHETLGMSAYVTLTALLQQLAHKPRTPAGYIITVALLVFSFVVAASYSANLTAFLIGIEQNKLKGIDSIREGAYQSDRIAVHMIPATAAFFEEQVLSCSRYCPG